MRRVRSVVPVAAVCAALLAGDATADAARAMLLRYAGSHDTDALLREPAVRTELKTLLGPALDHLERNLNVRGPADVIAGVLSVSGNAPHRGTEEEAVLCVQPPGSRVEAAILSRGSITVYARAEKYEYATLCIKDWVTLANSGHADRLRPPANLRLSRPP